MFNLISFNSDIIYPPGSTIPFPTKHPQSFTTDSQVDLELVSSNTDCATVSSTGTYPNQVITITTYQNGNSVITGVFTGWVKNDLIPHDQPNIVATPEQTGVPEGYTNVQITVQWTINVTGYFNAGGTQPIQPEPNENGVIEVEDLQRTQNLPEDGYFPVIDRHNNVKKVNLTQLVDAQLYNSLNVLYSEYRAEGIKINDDLNTILNENNSLLSRLNTQNVKQGNAQERIELKAKDYDVWDGSTASETLTGTGIQEDPYVINSCADWIRLISTLATYSASVLYVQLKKNLDFGKRQVSSLVLSNTLTTKVSFDFGNKEIKGFIGTCLANFNIPVAIISFKNLIINECEFTSQNVNCAPLIFDSECIVDISNIEVKRSKISHSGDTDGRTAGLFVMVSSNTPTGTHSITNCDVVDCEITSNKSRVASILVATIVSKFTLQNCYSKNANTLNGSTEDKYFAGIAVIETSEESSLGSFIVNNISETIQYGENCKFSYGTVAMIGRSKWSPSWYGNFYNISKSASSYYQGSNIERLSLSRNQIVINSSSTEGDVSFTITDGKALDTTEDLGYSLLLFDFTGRVHNDIIKIGNSSEYYTHTGANLFDISYDNGVYQILQVSSEEMSDSLRDLLSNFNKIQQLSVWDGTTYTEPSIGSGTLESPYEISSAAIFAYFLAKRTSSAYCKLTVDVSLNSKPLEYTASGSRKLNIDFNSHRAVKITSNGSILSSLTDDIVLRNGYLEFDNIKTALNLNSLSIVNCTFRITSKSSIAAKFAVVKSDSSINNVRIILRGSSQSFSLLESNSTVSDIAIAVDNLISDIDYQVTTDFFICDNNLGSATCKNMSLSGELTRSQSGDFALVRADNINIEESKIGLILNTSSNNGLVSKVSSFAIGNKGKIYLSDCCNLSDYNCSSDDEISEFGRTISSGLNLKNCESYFNVKSNSADIYRIGYISELIQGNSASFMTNFKSLPILSSTPYSNNGIKNYGAFTGIQTVTLISTATEIEQIVGFMFVTVAYQSSKIVILFSSRPMVNEFVLFIKSTFASVAFGFSIEGVQQTIFDNSQTTTPPTTGFNAFLKYKFWRIPGKDNTWCYTQIGS